MNAPVPDTTEPQIAELVRRFYHSARADCELGPLFESAIGDWDGHLRTVADFWSHVLLGTRRYQGSPYQAHTHLPLEPAHFERWLALFRQAAGETLPSAAAERAIARAEHMAESFKAGLFAFPGRKGPILAHPVKP